MTKQAKRIITTADWLSLVLALIFMVSVIQNAHDLVHDSVKNAPQTFAALLAVALQGIAWYHAQKTISKLGTITLTILAASLVIWLFGLSGR